MTRRAGRSRFQAGFTLIEAMIAVLVLALILRYGVPEMSRFIERGRLKAAAEEVYGQLNYARSQAIKQSADIYVNFSTDGSAAWSYGISSTAGCSPTLPVSSGSACKYLLDTVSILGSTVNDGTNKQFTNIKMTTSPDPYEITFAYVRGTASAGTVTVESPTGWQIQAQVSALGQVTLCSPGGTQHVGGYPEC